MARKQQQLSAKSLAKARLEIIKEKDIKFFETKKFKTLAAKWHAKLEKSGFDDAECFDSPRELMKEWHVDHFVKDEILIGFEAKQRYFELARQLLNTHEFATERERRVWEMYSEGVLTKNMPKILGCTMHAVRVILNKYIKLIRRDAKDILKENK
jgi:hypothetical protein